ncbi:MAG: AMP-binding protein, partial [Desulfobacteraceae bacterium]|nr:AMP-binding protein [Desulfobacteraceae bacterium]
LESCSDDLENLNLRADDPGLIIYTSGTTGDPKGAVLTQKNLVNDAQNVINIWEISDSDTLCHALPLFHVHGLCFALLTALISGSHVVLLDIFAAESVIDILKENNSEMTCSVFMGVPAMYSKLIDTIQDQTFCFNHMRLWTSGSAPLPAKEFQRIKQTFGKEPVEREGMSETGMNFSNPIHDEKKPGSIGIELPGLDVKIVDPDTSLEVEPGETGEFWLKSDSITPGYWKKPRETAKAFEQGWFKTGDLGRQDKNGYYYLTDRLKNIIITGGENVSPNEIETVINMIEEVIEVSVVGIFDEKWGEKIVAAVVKNQDSDDLTGVIKAICKKHLHAWKCPKEVIFIENLPKNGMGKILKNDLKKLF